MFEAMLMATLVVLLAAAARALVRSAVAAACASRRLSAAGLCALVSAALFGIAPAASGQLPAGDSAVVLVSGGVERSYRLHVPARYAGGRIALVLNFHAAGSTAEQQSALSGFDAIADREGFAVAYPEGALAAAGSTRSWNAAGEGSVDDVQFARDVIADVDTKLGVDGNRIFVTGFSAGARMASRLACELGDVLAAAAPVAGLTYPDDCRPAGAVSMVAFHGRADAVHGYDGAADTASAAPAGFEAAVEQWRAALECPAGAMEGGFAREPGLVLRVYPPCARGADLMLYIGTADGHVWPPGASERIWTFFKARPR